MALSPEDVKRIQQIEDQLGYSPHSFFMHDGGRTTLVQACGAWQFAKELLQIVKKEIPVPKDDAKV